MKKIVKYILVALVLLLIIPCGCKRSKKPNSYSSSYFYADYDTEIIEEGNEEGEEEDYKYEWESGREYNYDIYGEDEDGNEVTGNVTIDGESNSGHGYVEDEYGNVKDIDVYWVAWGEMEGDDEDGTHYTLRVE